MQTFYLRLEIRPLARRTASGLPTRSHTSARRRGAADSAGSPADWASVTSTG